MQLARRIDKQAEWQLRTTCRPHEAPRGTAACPQSSLWGRVEGGLEGVRRGAGLGTRSTALSMPESSCLTSACRAPACATPTEGWRGLALRGTRADVSRCSTSESCSRRERRTLDGYVWLYALWDSAAPLTSGLQSRWLKRLCNGWLCLAGPARGAGLLLCRSRLMPSAIAKRSSCRWSGGGDLISRSTYGVVSVPWSGQQARAGVQLDGHCPVR